MVVAVTHWGDTCPLNRGKQLERTCERTCERTRERTCESAYEGICERTCERACERACERICERTSERACEITATVTVYLEKRASTVCSFSELTLSFEAPNRFMTTMSFM